MCACNIMYSYIYVCMFVLVPDMLVVCSLACMYEFICACRQHICIHVCLSAYMSVRMFVLAYACMQCMYLCMYNSNAMQFTTQ